MGTDEAERRPLASRLGFASLTGRKIARMLRSRRAGPLVGHLSELVTGSNAYEVLARRRGGRFVERPINDYRMFLDLNDSGISRTLLRYGVHEQRSTDAFRRELRWLAAETDDPVVLDVGANIGYYTLLEAEALPGGHVYAFEPEPDNAALLDRNVTHNGHADRVTVERCAVGADERTVELSVSELSNRHRVRLDGGDRTPYGRKNYRGSVSVPQVSVDGFLDERGIDPAAVGAVRLDLEGYEWAVVEGMEAVLSAPGPLVVFVELHPSLGARRLEAIARRLDAAGLEVVSAALNESVVGVPGSMDWYGKPVECSNFAAAADTVVRTDYCLEVVARRAPS